MKRNRIIIPVVALLSHTMYAQTPVDMNLQLQNVEIQGNVLPVSMAVRLNVFR